VPSEEIYRDENSHIKNANFPFSSEQDFPIIRKDEKKGSSLPSKFIPNFPTEKNFKDRFLGRFNNKQNSIDVDYTIKTKSSKKRTNLGEEEIREALKKTGGNATQAAKLLGIHKATFYRKLKSLNLTKEKLVQEIFGVNKE
jgi:DNA-binding NtrC family response regulator